MKRIGFWLLFISLWLVLLGGVGDIFNAFRHEGLISSHQFFLGLREQDTSKNLILLDHAMLYALGTSLVATAILGLALLRRLHKQGDRRAMIWLLVALVLGVGNNALQRYRIDSPLYWLPLGIMLLACLGGGMWLIGKKK